MVCVRDISTHVRALITTKVPHGSEVLVSDPSDPWSRCIVFTSAPAPPETHVTFSPASDGDEAVHGFPDVVSLGMTEVAGPGIEWNDTATMTSSVSQ